MVRKYHTYFSSDSGCDVIDKSQFSHSDADKQPVIEDVASLVVQRSEALAGHAVSSPMAVQIAPAAAPAAQCCMAPDGQAVPSPVRSVSPMAGQAAMSSAKRRDMSAGQHEELADGCCGQGRGQVHWGAAASPVGFIRQQRSGPNCSNAYL